MKARFDAPAKAQPNKEEELTATPVVPEEDTVAKQIKRDLCRHPGREAEWHGVKVCNNCQLHLLRVEWYPSYAGELRDTIGAPEEKENTMKAKVDGKAAVKEAPAKKVKAAKVGKAKGERVGTPRAVGKKLKLGINATWVHLFQENEKLAKAGKPKTDEQITEFMYAEFAPRKSKVFAHVSSVRSRYNNGLLTQGEKPRIQSSPYNKRATDKKSK